MIDRFKFFAVALQNRILIYILSFAFKKRFSNLELVRCGTHYGGWWIPRAFLSRNFSRTLVSAGLGHDTSFDLLMAKSGAKIIGIDDSLFIDGRIIKTYHPRDYETVFCKLSIIDKVPSLDEVLIE